MSRSSRRVAPPGDAEPRLAAFRGHGAAWRSDLSPPRSPSPGDTPGVRLDLPAVGCSTWDDAHDFRGNCRHPNNGTPSEFFSPVFENRSTSRRSLTFTPSVRRPARKPERLMTLT